MVLIQNGVCQNGVSETLKWTLMDHVGKHCNSLIPNPTESNILILNTPNATLLDTLIKMGPKSIHIVDADSTRCHDLIESLSETPQQLKIVENQTRSSSDRKIVLHQKTFRDFDISTIKFNAIFDLGYLSALPDPDMRRAFGDKLIASAAEKAKMIIFTIENFNGAKPAHVHNQELGSIGLNLAYGRGFNIKKVTDVETSNGYHESLYTAEKCWAGGEYYNEKYAKGYSPWHMTRVNDNLERNYHQIQPKGEPLRKIVLPMCGKTVDIKWLADRGHEVVGIEISEHASREIFTRDNIPHEELDCPAVEGKLFRSKDGKIRVYNCDIFKFNTQVEGEFESVWERGAVLALDGELRAKYFAHMKTLVKKGCLWMTSIFQYDKNVYYNHPYCVNDDEIQETFSKDFIVKSIDETIVSSDKEYTGEAAKNVMVILMKRSKLKQISDRVYLLTKK